MIYLKIGAILVAITAIFAGLIKLADILAEIGQQWNQVPDNRDANEDAK